MRIPENQPKKYDHLFAAIDSGIMKIPQFQRDFVWNKEQTASLIDSIIKGFPIGTFIIWKTREELRSIKNIGNHTLPEIPTGDAAQYILDGQQRITSLYAVRKGLIIEKDGKNIDYKDIGIDLSFDPDDDEPVVMVDQLDGVPWISVNKMLNGSITQLAKEYEELELEKIEVYRSRLTGYDFSTVVINDYPLDIACEIFTRINTGGTELTLFEIMVAKTFDVERDFDLAREYNWLIDNNGVEKDLEDAGYDSLPPSTVLQCVSAHLVNHVRRKDILKLDKDEFIDAWPIIKDGIFTAVDYFGTHLRIPVSGLLPYNALLVPFTYFFIKNGGINPTPLQNKLLTQYYWWASLTQRFSSGVENKIAQDLERMNLILEGEQPSYRGEEVALDLEMLRYRWFSVGDAFCKAILSLYAYFEPKSFATNSLVKLDNSWLKSSTSKNYHHFFPKAYLKDDFPYWMVNCILNITIVDDYLNKRKIRAKAPSIYMQEFQENNKEIQATMHTHLIDGMDEFGIWENDYERFIEKRGERVMAEIEKRLYPDLE
ncbi:MAG: DUF262 domain-containing protein [Anaerolineales bacterium]|nr:DUF262 domain-containing protein [Anaerolineales bacterium]